MFHVKPLRAHPVWRAPLDAGDSVPWTSLEAEAFLRVRTEPPLTLKEQDQEAVGPLSNEMKPQEFPAAGCKTYWTSQARQRMCTDGRFPVSRETHADTKAARLWHRAFTSCGRVPVNRLQPVPLLTVVRPEGHSVDLADYEVLPTARVRMDAPNDVSSGCPDDLRS